MEGPIIKRPQQTIQDSASTFLLMSPSFRIQFFFPPLHRQHFHLHFTLLTTATKWEKERKRERETRFVGCVLCGFVTRKSTCLPHGRPQGAARIAAVQLSVLTWSGHGVCALYQFASPAAAAARFAVPSVTAALLHSLEGSDEISSHSRHIL